MKMAGQQYAKLCAERGRGHDLGPPHVHIWMALLEELAAQKDKVGLSNATRLEQMVQVMADMEMEELCDMVKVCKVSKTYESNTVRVTLAFVDAVPHRKVTIDAMKQLGGIHKLGRAPRSALEDQIQALLEQ
eukprot:TRINITY_DN39668_c0_g2_i1.p2 TRINITY_DN39668_c0_g2~~TRINITY_DN39668_c0_g2_i1.p2  ORF type:complete len:132 (-),score=38.96 TRINITY_DN39668_c0_g2_i1:32-427(-)